MPDLTLVFRYVYANNSPYKYFDPDGRDAADRFSDQYSSDYAAGRSEDYDAFVPAAATVAGVMAVGPAAVPVVRFAASLFSKPTGKTVVDKLAKGAVKDDIKKDVRQILKEGGVKQMEMDFNQISKKAGEVRTTETAKGPVEHVQLRDGTTVSKREFSSSNQPSIQVNDPASNVVGTL